MSATPHKKRAARRVFAAAAGLATLGALAVAAPAAGAHGWGDGHGNGHGHGHPKPRTLDVQLLSFNDLHGNLEPPAGSAGSVNEIQADGTVKAVPAGGAEYLASSLRTARKGNPYSITASVGDNVGASPLLSGLFHDEPTIEALNKIGVDVSAVGNHEFDEGMTELNRLQNGGCHPTAGCYETGKTFEGADFPYLAANTTYEKSGKPVFKPYTVWKKNGVKVGFIGVVLESTPDIVTAEGVKGLKFHDEIETVNKYARELDRQGVKSIVALVHEGGVGASSSYNYDCDSPTPGAGLTGPIVDIAKGITPRVDAVLTGHTHQAYACNVPDPAGNDRMVASAASFGKIYTDTTLTYDLRTKDIVREKVRTANHVVSREQAKATDMTDLIARWNKTAAPIAGAPQGFISADINGRGAGTPEQPLGNVIADAQLEGLAPADKGGAQLAFMNPGGIRADLVYAASGDEGDGVVTYGEAFTVQPFTNMMNVVDLTGAQIVTALQQQVSGANEASNKILQVSKGFTYTLDMTKTGADRIVTDSVKLNGEALDPAKTYRVAMNEFLGGGGDGFAVLGEGTNKLVGPADLDLFNTYLAAHSTADAPLAPPATDRITVIK